MDLVLESSNILQTHLLTGDSKAVYRISTDYNLFRPPTTISKIEGNYNTEIGHIEQGSQKNGNVTCHGQPLAIDNHGIFAHSKAFYISNNLCKWKTEGKNVVLKKDSKSERPVATFILNAGSHKDVLRIEADGASIINEIVVSFVYFVGLQKAKRRSRANRVMNSIATAIAYGWT